MESNQRKCQEEKTNNVNMLSRITSVITVLLIELNINF